MILCIAISSGILAEKIEKQYFKTAISSKNFFKEIEFRPQLKFK
jgi:hypothetical protein